MPDIRSVRRLSSIGALILLVGACATGPTRTEAPVAAAPPTAATPAVEPEPALLRAAERAELTGTELGSMWTFENAPVEYWQERYGFTATSDWLDHVRLASVRFGTFCSASFVSPDGLVMTNHHCARSCVEDVSTAQNDYVVNGFLAETRAEEQVCPGLFLDQLIEIEDVTGQVQAAGAGGTDREVAGARDSVRQAIESRCEAESSYECQVVSLYHGGQYQLYRYQRYQPVKLVMAPELQAGFFGGDPDNFTYPRYALDVAFVRAYTDDGATPASTPHYFEWDADGADEEELVFITGNPGGTDRLATVAQLMYERGVRHPFLVDAFKLRSGYLKRYAEQGPEQETEVRGDIFSVENSIKAFSGQLGGLEDTLLLARKIRWEQEFQRRVRQDPELQRRYGDVWSRIASLQPRMMELRPRVWLYNYQFFPSPHTQIAGLLIDYLRESALPESERSRGFQGEGLARVRQMLEQAAPDADRSIPVLAARLELARQYLPADDPLNRAIRSGESPEQAAGRLIRGSRVGEPGYRQTLMQAGAAALDTASDPMLALVRDMKSNYERASEAWQEVTAREAVQEERLAKALFAVYGTRLPPDATFTLRISDGVVRGYPYNGTIAPSKTTFYGMYGHAASHENEMPWQLPRSFDERRDAIDMSTPFNFVSTNDITGGNSGSPMIDRDARVVGIAFDGNIEQLPNEFLFTDRVGRTVAVHSAGIIEALRSVYQAEALVAEILGD